MKHRTWRGAFPATVGVVCGDLERLTAAHAIDGAGANGGLARGDAKPCLTRTALEIERDRIDLAYVKRSSHIALVILSIHGSFEGLTLRAAYRRTRASPIFVPRVTEAVALFV